MNEEYSLHPGLSGVASVRAPNIRSVKYAIIQNIIIHTNTAAAGGQCPPVATSCVCHPGVPRDSHVRPKSEIWLKKQNFIVVSIIRDSSRENARVLS